MNLQKQIALTKPEFISTFLVFLVVVLLVISSRLTRLTSNSSFVFNERVELILEDNTSVDGLKYRLIELGIEVDADELNWASNILGWRTFLRGRYVFEGEYSYNGVFSKLARGIQDPTNIVILPGTTQDRFTASVGSELNFSPNDLSSTISDSAFLAERELTEGQLFARMHPETYLTYWTISPKEFLAKVLREFDRAIPDSFYVRANKMGYSMDEILTLASIVEWEAKLPEEKARISGLYWNRLERGMRLQADPTVLYALGERRRLLFEDYQFEHPYNTYLRKGLPPGPITNPSYSTIEATLFPEDHDYLYMVANPEGGHTFTKTFREHQVESEKWRIWLREQYRIKRERERNKTNNLDREARS
jgi:UPF0755 protein